MVELKTAPPSQVQARRKQKGYRGSAHTMHRHSSCIAVPPKSCLETGQLLAEQKADFSYFLIISSSRMTLPSSFSLLSKVLCIYLIVSLKPLVASFHTVSCCIYCFQFRGYPKTKSVSCCISTSSPSLVLHQITPLVLHQITVFLLSWNITQTQNPVFHHLGLNLLSCFVLYFLPLMEMGRHHWSH